MGDQRQAAPVVAQPRQSLGQSIGGGAIELWDPYGLNAVFIGAFCLVLALALFLGLRRRSGT